MKLYNVDTTVEEFHGFKNVNIRWFVRDRMEPPAEVRLHEAIEGFDPDDMVNDYGGWGMGRYAMEALGELFTLEEAEMLCDYLRASHGDDPTITEADLPIPRNTMGVGAIPVGGGVDNLMLDKTPGYPLPFRVWGYYDLRAHRDEEILQWERGER